MDSNPKSTFNTLLRLTVENQHEFVKQLSNLKKREKRKKIKILEILQTQKERFDKLIDRYD